MTEKTHIQKFNASLQDMLERIEVIRHLLYANITTQERFSIVTFRYTIFRNVYSEFFQTILEYPEGYENANQEQTISMIEKHVCEIHTKLTCLFMIED